MAGKVKVINVDFKMIQSVKINGVDLVPIRDHYLFWWLGREPSQKDFEVINFFMAKINAVIIKVITHLIEFRIFIDDTISQHIIFSSKYWGFAVNVHIDIGIHYKSIFNSQTLKFLSQLYLYLKKIGYGLCFLLPRQEKAFKSFMKTGKMRWNLI